MPDNNLFLDPSIAPPISSPNAPRPFAPGEYVRNPDGGWSSEVSVTVTNPELNNGRPTVIPSLWLIGGKPQKVNEDQAVKYANQSGLGWPAFGSIDEAEKFANSREETWQKFSDPKDARSIPPLYIAPAPAGSFGAR